jgi:hypothetical protein
MFVKYSNFFTYSCGPDLKMASSELAKHDIVFCVFVREACKAVSNWCPLFFILEPCPMLYSVTELATQHVDGHALVCPSSTPDCHLQPPHRSKFVKPVLAQSA